MIASETFVYIFKGMGDESFEVARRKALQTAVSALCVEAGFVSAEKDAVGVLTEMMQSCKCRCMCFY